MKIFNPLPKVPFRDLYKMKTPMEEIADMPRYQISPFDEPSKYETISAVSLIAAINTYSFIHKEGAADLETPNTFTTEWGRYWIRRVRE